MCAGEKLSYSAFPAGHIFRLGIAIIVLTSNCVVMRIAASFALSAQQSQAYCLLHPTACSVTGLSFFGSLLPILFAVLTGSFAIVAAKRFFKWAFIVTFAFGCVLMTISFLLNILFNGLRHGFNIAPVLVPDILEINLFCVINLLTMVVGILCVKSLVRDRSERYLAAETSANAITGAATTSTLDDVDGIVAETEIGRDNVAVIIEAEENGHEDGEAFYATAADGPGVSGSSNSLRPPPTGGRNSSGRLPRTGSSLSGRGAARVRAADASAAAQVTVVVENESGKVTNFDIFSIEAASNGNGGGRRSK